MRKGRRERGAFAEGFAALIASAAFFAFAATFLQVLDHLVLAVALGALCIAAIAAAARYRGVAYAVPLAIAGMVAFDWYEVPPTHPSGFPDVANSTTVLVYLAVAVLIGQLVAREQRRAQASEHARTALAEEQAALRRVATLVAQGAPPTKVFSAVADEADRFAGVDLTSLHRFEVDGAATVVARWGFQSDALPVGDRWRPEPPSVVEAVRRTGRSARVEDFRSASGAYAAFVNREGMRSAVAIPVVVDGLAWGAAVVASRRASLPGDTERRLADFTELLASAIANAESRAELMASRARVVSAADETRRRIERDLHDGVQHRLVSLALELRSAETLAPEELGEVREQLVRLREGLTGALDDLRDVSHGIHPAILSEGGLEYALTGLAARSAIPVELEVSCEGRLPERVEVAAYYIAAEALTNVAKHAQASAVDLRVERRDDFLHLSLSDDGVGGADPDQGSGLLGLTDRVAALGGTILVQSPVGAGTSLDVKLPVDGA